MTNTQAVQRILEEAINEINLQLPPGSRLRIDDDRPLYGHNGMLDSLGLINFIVLIEKLISRHKNAPVNLTESTQDDPRALDSIQLLGEHLETLLQPKV